MPLSIIKINIESTRERLLVCFFFHIARFFSTSWELNTVFLLIFNLYIFINQNILRRINEWQKEFFFPLKFSFFGDHKIEMELCRLGLTR